MLPESQIRRRPVDLVRLGVQTQGDFDLGGRLIMTAMLGEDSRLDSVGLGQIGVERKRPFCRHQTVIAASAVDEAQGHLPNRHERPGTRILRIDFDGAVAQPDNRFHPPDVGFMAGDVGLPRQEIEIVGLDIVRAALLDRLLLLGQELEFQGLDDGLGDFGLQREDVEPSTS